ncbi:MAG TPA: hypothetical protein VG146_14345 [Verrucomicrobiae bacterium]|nr:hypothetical protein [Verrucomicrobiae bacterium]
MASFGEYKRRLLLPVVGLILAGYYLLVFLPVSRHLRTLDGPLQKAWTKLAVSLDQTNATTLDFLHITNQLNETLQARAILEDTKMQAASRIELSPGLRAKLNTPFQLLDYQNERSKQMDDLDTQARLDKIIVEPSVYAGFPEHTADLKEPVLLWPALAFTDDLLQSALRCKVAALHSLDVALALTNSPATDTAGRLAQIPIQVEFTATARAAAQVIESLPLRAEEIRAAGLPEAPHDKMPLFIDRLIIRKQSPEKPDEVRVWLRVVGFVLRD